MRAAALLLLGRNIPGGQGTALRVAAPLSAIRECS